MPQDSNCNQVIHIFHILFNIEILFQIILLEYIIIINSSIYYLLSDNLDIQCFVIIVLTKQLIRIR